MYNDPLTLIKYRDIMTYFYSEIKPLIPIDLTTYEILKFLTNDLRSYEYLKKKNQVGPTIYLTDTSGKHQESLLGELGKGGCKKAIQLANGRALMLPNLEDKYTYLSTIAERWDRIVIEEVKMSEILHRIGLLSPSYERVTVSLSDSSQQMIPAYISESFENLSNKGWLIIDQKNKDSSTWKEGKNHLFQTDEERFNESNWDTVVDSLLNDIVKICVNGIPIQEDSSNIAVVKNPSDEATCPYKLRYFGFDFSKKYSLLEIPEKQEYSSADLYKDNANKMLRRLLLTVLTYELNYKYLVDKKIYDLGDRLVNRYSEEMLRRINGILFQDK